MTYFNRVDIRIVFTDEKQLEYKLPLDLLDREISHFEVNGERYEKTRETEQQK